MLSQIFKLKSSTEKKLWNVGKNDEIIFWDNWFATKGSEWPDEYLTRFDPNKPLQPWLHKFIPQRTDISILDVGSGPLTILGKSLLGHNITITAVDPLADTYIGLMEKYGIVPLVSPLSCDVEKLSSMFNSNRFDLVFMQNALDHSYDPLNGIKEMLKCVKPNCYVCLSHSSNEAEKQSYTGFHQWNLCIENNDFRIWNKNKMINVTKQLNGVASVEVIFNGDWFAVAIHKK